MATFSKFISSFNPDSKGKEFEHFVKWFLQNDPQWSTQVDQIWLWDDYPERWGRDKGIDLVFQHKSGEIWAVQAKCYDPKYYITKTDVDKFLSESGRPIIDKRLLIASTDRLGEAKDVCDAQEKPVTYFLLSHFDESEVEYPNNLSELKTAKIKERPPPNPHQLEAVNDIENGFNKSDRGQLISACGTGKTYTSVWVKERLSAKTTLVLVPSLSLLSQTLREWTFIRKKPFDVLCVCSDQSVGKAKDDDALIQSIKDVSFPVTTKVQEIDQFLGSKRDKVIFSTYQSSPLIAEAQSNSNNPTFDLVVADEAHQCAGKVESDFATVLDEQKIRAKKRLFVTATPRTYSVSLKRKASERGVEVTCMDDEAVFGKVFHKLKFGEAIARGLLTDYQVIIIGVDDPMIAEWIEQRELVQFQSGNITDAESLASQIGLIKTIKDYNLKRMISFHNRVKHAEEFASEICNLIHMIPEKHKPTGSILSDFVSGKMSAHDRRIKLEKIKKLKKGARGILSNARCLSEGIDIPSLDGVVFIDPKRSTVDIVQAVGRAIRLDDDKKIGTIVLPIFIKEGENPEASIQKSNFKPVSDVLNALKAHDDVLSFELDQLRTNLGKKKPTTKKSGLSKIYFDLPLTVDHTFSDSIKTFLVEKTTSSWYFWFGLLEAYTEQNNSSRISLRFITEDTYKLGSWVSKQRQYKSSLTAEQIQKLEALPDWSWDPILDDWNKNFSCLLKFVDRKGHARVPPYFVTEEGVNLGDWVLYLRRFKKNRTPEQIERLEALPGWSWDPILDDWNKGLSYLIEFVDREKHAKVEISFTTEDGFALGRWVSKKRFYKDSLTPEKIKELESVPGWIWKLSKTWEEGFLYFKDFIDREGHANMPTLYKTENGFTLGKWVQKNRQNKKKGKLSTEKIKKLEALPEWVWQVRKSKKKSM